MRLSVNYFANLRAECHFSKLGCNESSFPKKRGVSVIYSSSYYTIFFHFYDRFLVFCRRDRDERRSGERRRERRSECVFFFLV
jgi:hypothetical protein